MDDRSNLIGIVVLAAMAVGTLALMGALAIMGREIPASIGAAFGAAVGALAGLLSPRH